MNQKNVGLWVRLEAKPGKENDVAEFLKGGLELVQQEPKTLTWYAIQLNPSTFGIFDTFSDDSGRDAHLAGRVAEALMAKAHPIYLRNLHQLRRSISLQQNKE
jgi:quinol monooxygenase YgiN